MTYCIRTGMIATPVQTTDGDIEAFEREFGRRLPADYREFLLDLNGVEFIPIAPRERLYYPVRAYYTVEQLPWPPVGTIDSNFVDAPSSLMGINVKPEALDPRSRYYDFHNSIGNDWLAIGFSMVNMILCVSCGSDCFGQVFEWDIDRSRASGDPAPEEGLTFLSPSFSQWWADLIPLSDLDIEGPVGI